jgi:hypothetical protein
MSGPTGTDADRDVPAYIARAACGCTKMATVDLPEHAKDNAKEIARCMRVGLTIERVTVGWVRDNWHSECEVCRPRKKAERGAAVQETLL